VCVIVATGVAAIAVQSLYVRPGVLEHTAPRRTNLASRRVVGVVGVVGDVGGGVDAGVFSKQILSGTILAALSAVVGMPGWLRRRRQGRSFGSAG
jgi:hypothetical protein